MTAENTLTLTQKIREDWGSVPFFCRKNDINYNTFKQVIYGYGTSKKITDLLKKYKYIKNANELKKAS